MSAWDQLLDELHASVSTAAARIMRTHGLALDTTVSVNVVRPPNGGPAIGIAVTVEVTEPEDATAARFRLIEVE